MDTAYLTASQTIALHDRTLELHGGLAGILSMSALESALAMPAQSFAGTEVYETLAEKAATYCYLFIKNHPFVDGNKRIGIIAANAFLALNGVVARYEAGTIESTAIAVAEGTMSRDELIRFYEKAIARRVL